MYIDRMCQGLLEAGRKIIMLFMTYVLPLQNLQMRTATFAVSVRNFIKEAPRTIANVEYSKQLIRSSGSVAANYIEANECLGKNDFCMRIRIAKKEAKESRLWLWLINIEEKPVLENCRTELMNEARELTKIFASIVARKSR